MSRYPASGSPHRRPARGLLSRGAAITIAAALSTAAIIAGTATPVRAQSGSITVQASSPPTSVGSLSVSLTTADGEDISDFTAHILTASGTDVLDLPDSDFTLGSGTEAAGTWTIDTPITTSQLLLGTYTVTVDATDNGGGSVTGADAGQLAYLIQPTVTLAANPAALGYGAASTTLSGTVTGLLPDGSTSPLAGQQVEITDSSDNAQSTQTDSAGDFSISKSYASTFTATVRGSTLATASSAPVTVAASTAPTDLTATVSTAQVTFGQQVTVTGTLTYQPGTSPEGLAGVSVVVLAPGYPDLSVPVTDSSGNFTATFTATQSGPVQVYFNSASYEQGGSYPYLAPAQVTTDPVTVSLPTSLTRFSAKVATSGTVSVSGCLGVTGIPASSSLSVEGSITIRYAARRSGPWHTLGRITHTTASAGATCGVATAEASFSGAFTARLPRAYYRASFTPRSDASWLASVSSPVLAWKYRTEIKSLKVSPTRLKKGRKLTVSGQLFQDKRRWVPFGKQTIEIIWRKPDTKAWDYTVTVKTTSRGRFTATVRVSSTALWSAYYPGRSSDYSTAPPGVRVTVT